MATVGLAPNGPVSAQEGASTPGAGTVPVFSADRSCMQEVEQILKDYASVIEDVIVPKNIKFWALYWSSWPSVPEIPSKDTAELQRYTQLLQNLRSMVDKMLGFYFCYAGVLLWVLTALVSQVVLVFVECTDCEQLANANVPLAVVNIAALIGIMIVLVLWNQNRCLPNKSKLLLACLLGLSHCLIIFRMIIPASLSTLFFRILCLRALTEIPLVSQQNLVAGWIRIFILDSAKVLVLILHIKFANPDHKSEFSFTLLIIALPIYLLSFVAGFSFQKADIILKKKFAVGVERLSERILHLLLTISRFGGVIPDKIYEMIVPTKSIAHPKSQNLSTKVHPLTLKGSPKLQKDDVNSRAPSNQKEAQVPEESARPLKRLTPPKKTMHLQLAQGHAKLNDPEPALNSGHLGEKPGLQKFKELQKRHLPPLMLQNPINNGPMISRRLVSMELDPSPKFGPIPEESSQTFNSPMPRSPRPPEQTVRPVGNYCPKPSESSADITKEFFLGETTTLEVWLGDKLLRDKHPNSVDSIALAGLSGKFKDVSDKARQSNIWISTSHLMVSLGLLPPETSLLHALGGVGSDLLHWAAEEMHYLLHRTHEDFSLVFSELYAPQHPWVLAAPNMQSSGTFGSKSSGEGRPEDETLQVSMFPTLVVNPALLRFRSMSLPENALENKSPGGSIIKVPNSKLLIHASYSQADAVWKFFAKIRKPTFTSLGPKELEQNDSLSPIKLAGPKSAFHLPRHLTPDIQPGGDSRLSNTRVYNIKDSVITLGAKSQTEEQKSIAEITPKKSSLKQSHSSIGVIPSLGPGPFTKAVGAFQELRKEHQNHTEAYPSRARTESVDEVYFCDFRNTNTLDATYQNQANMLEFSGFNGELGIQSQPNSKKRVKFTENGGHLPVPKTKSHPTTPREVMSPKFGNEARRGDVSGTGKKNAFQFDPAELKPNTTGGASDSKQEKAPATPPTPGAVNPVSPPTSSLKNFQSNYEDIVAMVVHDMRSPLGCIIGNLELIDSELRESLQKIQNTSSIENRTPSAIGGSYAARSHNSINMTTLGLPNHPLASLYVLLSPLIKSSKSATTLLETLVNDMLDAARISKGIFRVSTEDVDVRKVVQECLDTVGIAAKAKRLNLSYQIDGFPRILSDHQRIKQVLLNFLSNSIKFTPNNGSVKIRVEDWGGKTLRWTVEDNGEGIKPEHMSKMFEKFQSDRASRSNSKGIGLGLYICKNIIEALGPKGCISVSSEPRVSTKISFDLYKDMAGKAAAHDTPIVKSSNDIHQKADLIITPKRIGELTSSATELEGETKRSKLLDSKSPKIVLKPREMLSENRAGPEKLPSHPLKEKPGDNGPVSEKKKEMNPALTHSQKNDIFRLTDAGVAVSKRIIEVRLRTGRNHKFSLVEGHSQLGDGQSHHERSVKSFHQYRPRNEQSELRTKQELMNSDNAHPRTTKHSVVRGGLSDDEGSHNQEENKTVHKCESIMQASINLCPTPNDSNNASRQEFNSVAKKALNNSQLDSSKIFNVLIVEDEPTLMELYGHFCARFSDLKKFPVEFLQATSLEDGLRVISQVPLDVIITDFSLPDGNGLQLAREIDNYSDSCKPLLVLASGERSFDPQRTHEISQRFFQVMHKPISMKLWMQTLEECLGEIRHRDTQVLASLSPRMHGNYFEDSGNDTETEKNF